MDEMLKSLYAARESAKETLADIDEAIMMYKPVKEPVPVKPPYEIVQAVAERYRVTTADIYGRSRKAEIVRARHVAFYLIKELSQESTVRIGQLFGMDYTSVGDAIRKVDSDYQMMAEAYSIQAAL